MSTEIATQTPTDYAQLLRDKIRSEFANLIPEQEWQRMIEQEIKAFTAPVKRQTYSGIVEEPSPFQTMIREEMKAKFKKMVQDTLASDFLSTVWVGAHGVQTVSDAVRKVAAEAAPEILQTLVQGIVIRAVESIRNQAGC